MKLRKLLFASAIAVLFVGCQDEAPEVEDIEKTQIEVLTPSPLTVSGEEGTAEVKFNISSDWEVEVANGEGWCTVVNGSGKAGENISIELNLTENNTGKLRSAGIKVRSNGKNASVILTQEEVIKIELLSAENYSVSGAGGEVEIEFNSTKAWEAELEEDSEWCSLDNLNGDEGENIIITAVVERNLGDKREATIVLSSLGKEYEITIAQDKKISYTFELGDYYPYPDSPAEAEGIVYFVSNDGNNGKCVSVAEGMNLDWGPIYEFKANDKTNGRNNMSKVKKLDAEFELHSVFNWADSLNNHPKSNVYLEDAKNVWYIPSIEELKEVYNNKEIINTAMEGLSKPQFEEEYPNTYWSSTEGTEASAAVLHFSDGKSDYAHKLVGECRLHRAILQFSK